MNLKEISFPSLGGRRGKRLMLFLSLQRRSKQSLSVPTCFDHRQTGDAFVVIFAPLVEAVRLISALLRDVVP